MYIVQSVSYFLCSIFIIMMIHYIFIYLMKTYTRTTIITNFSPNNIYEDQTEKELDHTREKSNENKQKIEDIDEKDMQTELSTYLDNLVQ